MADHCGRQWQLLWQTLWQTVRSPARRLTVLVVVRITVCLACFVLVIVFLEINILLFAIYFAFIGLCCHQYNGNFLYDSRFFINDSIFRLAIGHICVNSAFINSKLQSNFFRNTSSFKKCNFSHKICISILLIISGGHKYMPRSHYQIFMWHLQ